MYCFKSKYSSKKGFTLVELLAAVSLTTAILTIGGVALVNLTRDSVKSQLEMKQHFQLNRLVELISREIQNTDVSLDPSTAPTRSKIPSDIISSIPSNAKFLLLLNTKKLAAPIVYFSVSANSSYNRKTWTNKDATNIVLYRWGPKLGAYYSYKNPGKPELWGSPIAIADFLSATAITGKCPEATAWKLSPESGTTEGVFVCVKPGKGSKLVYLNLVGARKWEGNIIKSRIDTQVYSPFGSK